MDGRRRSTPQNAGEWAALRSDYMWVMYAALQGIATLMRDHSTEEERREGRRLSELANAASDAERPPLIEQQIILMKAIETRRDVSAAREEGDAARAAEIEIAHNLWLRRMRAARAALDVSGLRHAKADVTDRVITISVFADSVGDVDASKPAFMLALRRELKALKAKVRFTIFTDRSAGVVGVVLSGVTNVSSNRTSN